MADLSGKVLQCRIRQHLHREPTDFFHPSLTDQLLPSFLHDNCVIWGTTYYLFLFFDFCVFCIRVFQGGVRFLAVQSQALLN